MSADQAEHGQVSEREARQVAEEAREAGWEQPSFGKQLFLGDFRLDLIHPHPRPDAESSRRGGEFCARLREFCEASVDAAQIERDARIPDEVVKGLAAIGTFGMKVAPEYGGLGLSNLYYNRALMIVGSVCPALAAMLSAHQSIGVPQPLAMFGTDEQKQRYLPRCARGEISAFLLTEPDVGSDPARLTTTATPSADGSEYVLDGEKLWTTNGVVADLLVVMAKVPKGDGHRGGITAFVVEATAPGITVERRNAFMGLRGLENGLTRFDQVRVPAADRIGREGQGLKIALTTLNTGRLALPAGCAATGKLALKMAREWSRERVQWGRPVGEHEEVAVKISFIAATTYALEAMVELSSQLADDKRNDFRIEAALAKLWCSEMASTIADELVQIRGGRGYETAASLAARGERGVPAEQMLRDMRINRIFEGSSEIMRLFIAREAVDAHLSAAGDLIDPQVPIAQRTRAAGRPAASTPGGCPRWSPATGRSPAPTATSARWPRTCGTWSGPAGSWPGSPSTGWRDGRAGSSTSSVSWAGSSTSARSCSRSAPRACGPSTTWRRPPGPAGTRRRPSWPACSAPRRGCGPRNCSASYGATPTVPTRPWRGACCPAATCGWRTASSIRRYPGR